MSKWVELPDRYVLLNLDKAQKIIKTDKRVRVVFRSFENGEYDYVDIESENSLNTFQEIADFLQEFSTEEDEWTAEACANKIMATLKYIMSASFQPDDGFEESRDHGHGFETHMTVLDLSNHKIKKGK